MYALIEGVGPVLVGILTVPAFGYIKQYLHWVDARAPWVQQLGVVVAAILLTWLGQTLNVALPTDLALFTETDLANVSLASVTAFLAHKGKG